MLNYLKNNFVLSAILALLITIFVYIQKRMDDDRSNKENSSNMKNNVLFYAKLFIVVYALSLLVLLFKTKDYSLPFKMKGGSSIANVLGKSSTPDNTGAPWKPREPIVTDPVPVSDILQEVDINEPKF